MYVSHRLVDRVKIDKSVQDKLIWKTHATRDSNPNMHSQLLSSSYNHTTQIDRDLDTNLSTTEMPDSARSNQIYH